MQSRKETAWKKSRKFGDIKGGRVSVKLADNVFKKYHSLERPIEGQELPIYFKENPSRDFFHPIGIDDIEKQLKAMPKVNVGRLTHIWLRKVKKSEYEAGKSFQACFIDGSGVNLIVLTAFPTDLKMRFGNNKPMQKDLKLYAKWTDKLDLDEKGWYLIWTEEGIKDYYLNYLLLHEIGHYIESDYARYDSQADKVKRENFADNFARVWYNENSKNE